MHKRLIVLFLLSLTCFCFPAKAVTTPTQRYVTTWDPEPIARFVLAGTYEANAAQCRIKLSTEEWGKWFGGRVIKADKKEVLWNLPVESLEPGLYAVQHDLRTPLGAERWDGSLRVPFVARWAGEPITADENVSEWPQVRLGAGFQEKHKYWFAWDWNFLYVAIRQEPIAKLTIYPDANLEANAEQAPAIAAPIGGKTEYAIPWDDLAPAGPHRGQMLRVRFENDPVVYDLLFQGSGKRMYFGTAWVSTKDADDQGPPQEVLRSVFDRVPGFNLRSGGISWNTAEPNDPGDGPSHYDWSSLDYQPNLYYPGLVVGHVETGNEWAEKLKETDPVRYRKLADRFIKAAVPRLLAKGITSFSCGWNEPELFHFTNREKAFLDDLNLTVGPLREAAPEAKVMAGKFSSGSGPLLKSFVKAGMRDNVDVVDIHPYNNDPRTGCDMGGVVEAHQALESEGMGHKQLYLGEGWGPTRNLMQVGRGSYDEPVSEKEADYMRQYFWNGFRCLTTPCRDYNPEWVLGALFFTLNDNVGGTYWQVNARPHYNAKGEVDYCLLSYLAFPCTGLKAFFCNGGLVDFFGKPKGDWLFDFPPSLPDVRLRADFTGDYMVIGATAPVQLRIYNAENQPIQDLKLGVRPRHQDFQGGLKGELVSQGQGPTELAQLAPSASWRPNVLVEFTRTVPATVRVAFELDFKLNGRNYTVDDVIPISVREPVEAWYTPAQVVLSDGGKASQATLVIRNNTSQPVTSAFSHVPAGLKAGLQPSQAVGPAQSATYALTVAEAGKSLSAGLYALKGDWGTPGGLLVKRPLAITKLAKPVVIDGELSDWPQAQDQASQVVLGGDLKFDALEMQVPFPIPNQVENTLTGIKHTPKPDDKPNRPAPDDTLAAHGMFAWDQANLYVAFIVTDATHHQNNSGPDTWRNDSIQIAFDPKNDGAPGQATTLADYEYGYLKEDYGPDDYEICLALTPNGPELAYTRPALDRVEPHIVGAELAVKHEHGHTVYEGRIPWQEIGSPQGTFGMDVLVNDSDDQGRLTLGWADSIANGKYPSRFVPVVRK